MERKSRVLRFLILGVIFAFVCASAPARAQDALQLAFDRRLDTAHAINDRIASCRIASEAQGVDTDVRAFAYVDLAMAYDANGDHDAALQALNTAADLRSDVWQVYFNRGQILAQHDEPEAGLADYQKFLQIDPSKIPMFRQYIGDFRTLHDGEKTDMSSSEREENRHTEAQKQLSRLVAISFARRCELRQRSPGTLDGALSDCNQALTMQPDNARMILLRGIVHMDRKEYTAGHADFDAAAKADPHSADALYLRGISAGLIGDQAASKADIAAALALDPQVAKHFEHT